MSTSSSPHGKDFTFFKLYEDSVQSPEWQVEQIPYFHRKITGRTPLRMREDFCGTGQISCEWVKKSTRHYATGLDIDEPTLRYAEEVNRALVSPKRRHRVKFLSQNVLVPTKDKFDVIGAHNFSFYVLHDRKDLLKYAKAALKSLSPGGTFFLEMAGGPGFKTKIREPKSVRVPGIGKIEYVWEQGKYDPVRALNDYYIHFKLPNGRWLRKVFHYHWRLWGIREVQEVLRDAGFTRSEVVWHVGKKGEGTSEYRVQNHGDPCDTWLAYVVGVKS